LFFVQTDNAAYWQYLLVVVPAFFDFVERSIPWPDAPKGRTRREIIALRRGLPVYRGFGKKRTDLDTAQAMARAAALPLPRFDAGPADRQLEELEQEPRTQ
jgi:tRNA (guanine-N7-)-methyltransferase